MSINKIEDMDMHAFDIYFHVSSQKGVLPIPRAISNGTPLKTNQSFPVSFLTTT